MHEQQRKLQREANSLAQRLEAVLQDKFTPRTAFDADTPIDKTLKFLQECIGVSDYLFFIPRLNSKTFIGIKLESCMQY